MSDQVQNSDTVTSQEARAFVLSAIAISSGIFGIAFWYGVFGTVFFEHLLYVWVAATVALVASLLVPPVDALPSFMSWRGRFVLALPSLWLLVAAIDGDENLVLSETAWPEWALIVAILAMTLPYLVYVLVMVAVPDIETLTQPRLRIAVWVIAVAIAFAGYGIGAHHPRFLTCYDFDVSGSHVPDNCRESSQSMALSTTGAR